MSFLDLTNVEEPKGFSEITPGIYDVQADDAEVVDTKSGTGKMLKMKLKILGGDFDNRTLFHTFNIQNESKDAQDIGLQQLKGFLVCSNKPAKLESPKDVVGGRCQAKVVNKEYQGKTYTNISYFQKSTTANESASVFG